MLTSVFQATPLAGDLYTPGLGVDPEDLSTDYEDFASSIEGLGYLESGITKPLNQVASTMLEFAKLQRQAVSFTLTFFWFLKISKSKTL